MRKTIQALTAAAVMAAGIGGITAPAQAHVSTGVAIASGLLGLGVGAAIASDHPRRYYNEGYYAPPPPTPVYYAPPPPPPAYSYEYVQRCRVVNHWSDYYGRWEQSRQCY